MSSDTSVPDGTGLIAIDPWLEPYAPALRHRYNNYRATLRRICEQFGSLEGISRGHEHFGFNRGEHEGQPGVWYREWAPGAHSLHLIGEFNGWDRRSHPLLRDDFGVWSIFLPDEPYASRLIHGSEVKVHVVAPNGVMDRIPAYIRRVVQDEETKAFAGQFWCPPEPFNWANPVPPIEGGLRVYEAHIGMAQEEEKLGTYREFTENVLPRIADLGYNAVQLMAIMEHPYYGSFGYHVSNFYAASSRFGTPEDLKHLIDTAHSLGLRVLLDLIHSHSVKNIHDGLNQLDGTDFQYFHAGPRGRHDVWDSLIFDYGKTEVLRFLLSNIRFWLEEYRFDGFRFDGITAMMYLHRGLGGGFHSYDDYLINNIDEQAIAYLQMANQLAHEIRPDVITVAEDASGMVGLARPVDDGGLGFDYRLAMGIPDYWIKVLREKRDEDWSMGEMFHMLLNRRQGEKHIAYCESHDQALVGDKTIAFWLMDADMYWHMDDASRNPVIDRGIALHKMIRLISFALGGEGYLNFMGNEFGHPEWVDFPREGNNFSYKYARRQWSLVDHPTLRYRYLNNFDRAMQGLDRQYRILPDPFIEALHMDDQQKIFICRRGPIVFVLNFHPHESYTDYRFGVPDPTDYQVVLDTDRQEFGGFNRISQGQVYPMQKQPCYERRQSIQIYVPARTAQVLAPATIRNV
ncbi:MAG: alpha amylase C-terminal domain-containing protein [Phycisphaerae bacterium]|nr:alpha amylase C-terminal domain-containing protein [Phycisphaerae bacterium]